MAKRFLTTLSDGRLAVTQINGDDPDGTKLAKTLFELSRDGSDMTTHFDSAAHTLKAIAGGMPGHMPLACRECDDTDLPADRADRNLGNPTFRDAWEDTGTAVQTNMPKARLIHMGRIRSERDAALSALDVPFMRAVEAGDAAAQQRIAAEKQALRDIPQTFDLDGCATPEALGAAWPDGLARP